MANETTETKPKTDWERGQDALETILGWVPIEKFEALAKKIDDKDFRKSLQYKMILSSL